MYAFFPEEKPTENYNRIVHEKISENLDFLSAVEQDPVVTVHEIRKNIKRVRALLRLVEPALDREVFHTENKAWRDLGRLFSDLRDRAVLIETLDRIIPTSPTLEEASGQDRVSDLRNLLAASRDGAYRAFLEDRKLHLEVRNLLIDFRSRIAVDDPVITGEILVAGKRRSEKRAKKRYRLAEKSPDSSETFHEWRKRVKDLWYHHELLLPLSGEAPPYIDRLHALDHVADLLGLAHDAAELESWLRQSVFSGEIDIIRKVNFYKIDHHGASLAHGQRLFDRN